MRGRGGRRRGDEGGGQGGEGGRRVGGQRGEGRRGGGGERRRRMLISKEIRATVIDYVLNHGLQFFSISYTQNKNSMCAAMNHHGILHHHAHLGAYNTARLLAFLDGLRDLLIPPGQIDNPQRMNNVVIWDNVSFQRAAQVRQ